MKPCLPLSSKRVPAKKQANIKIFVNCPFDPGFVDIFRAIIFAVRACGFLPCCAKDENDGALVRINKIYELIKKCDWGIHDLSEVTLDKGTNMPRFNMPLELGISLGAKYYGGSRQKRKRILILDKAPHNYDASTSDISGQDIDCHGGKPDTAIITVRNWLSDNQTDKSLHLPGGQALADDYKKVRAIIDQLIKDRKFDSWSEMTHSDYLGCLDAALGMLSPTSSV